MIDTMENMESSNNDKDIVTISRSKRKLSVVDWWYLRLLIMSVVYIVILIVFCFIIDKSMFFSLRLVVIISIISFLISIYYSLINKGSLVDSVTIDYEKQEIHIRHYTLLKKERNVTIPFEGFYWSILNGGRSQDRLRFKHNDFPTIVICEDSLGWTFEDCTQLHQALSRITPKNKGLGMI